MSLYFVGKRCYDLLVWLYRYVGDCSHDRSNITDLSADKNINPVRLVRLQAGAVLGAGGETAFVAVTVLSFDLSADSIFMAARFKIQFNLLEIIIMLKTMLIKHFSLAVRRD